MERFKAMERELKTKAFSEAGLNAASRVDPEVRDKDVLRQWLAEMTDTLNTQIDAFEAEQEILRAGGRKGKRADKDRLQKIDHSIERHKHHQTCLEIILRMLDNGNLKPDEVLCLI